MRHHRHYTKGEPYSDGTIEQPPHKETGVPDSQSGILRVNKCRTKT